MMLPIPDPMCPLALGLSVLLAVRAGHELSWGEAPAAAALPAWLPIAGLAAIAVVSSVLGVLNPEAFIVPLGAS